MNIRTLDSQEQVICRRYRTRSQTRRMIEESNARIEWLEKESQESQAQMSEMMELIRTLIKDKGQALGPGPQNEIAQPDQRGRSLYTRRGSLPHLLRMST